MGHLSMILLWLAADLIPSAWAIQGNNWTLLPTSGLSRLERPPRIQPDLLRRAVRSTQGDDALVSVYVRHRMNRKL